MRGIYIPGMEMPKNCEDCMFCENDGVPWCCITRHYIDEVSCPLVPVPDHGRFVEVLKTERECVSRDCDRDCGRCDLSLERNEILSVYDALLAMFSDQTIIPADKGGEG